MSESKGLQIAREWKGFWMSQHQNSKEDFENYHRRAFGVDANMIHDIGDRFDKAFNESNAEIQRLHRVIAKELTENDELGCEYTYVNTLRQEVKDLQARIDQAVEYCGPHTHLMWAASVIGILKCVDFKDAQEEYKKLKAKVENDATKS